jgi:glc operon protein GlcG
VTLDEARNMIEGALAHAKTLGVKVAVIVVDEGGLPIASARMDGTLPWALQVAEAKAVGSALWHRDGDYIAKVAQERPTDFQQLNALPVLRGLPLIPALGALLIRSGEQVLGAVAVSGGRADKDKECAQAALDVLGDR